MTRNRVDGKTSRGFESHLLRQIKPSVRAAFSFEGGIRKAAPGNVPVARCSRRGFSAEKESHLLRQNQAVRQGGFFI